MALSIKHADADCLARVIANHTGETLTEAVVTSLRERWERIEADEETHHTRDQLRQLRQRVSELPVRDARDADEVIGYDEFGLPT